MAGRNVFSCNVSLFQPVQVVMEEGRGDGGRVLVLMPALKEKSGMRLHPSRLAGRLVVHSGSSGLQAGNILNLTIFLPTMR